MRQRILKTKPARAGLTGKSRQRKRARASGSVRQQILAGGRRHFFTHGFRGVTMNELAHALGMSKKTIYLYFANKDSLLDAVIKQKFDEVDRDLTAATSGCEREFAAALRGLLICLHGHMEELRPAFVRDMQRVAPSYFEKILVRRRTLIERHFTRLLNAGQKAGVVRRDLPVAVMIAILLGTTEAIVTPAKVAQLHLTPRTAFAVVLKVFLEGVLTSG